MALSQIVGKVAAGAYKGRFRSSGKYLFVAHPNCCNECKILGMTPHFFNTPDVAFISHPNCLCATIEAPAGLSPAQLMEWAKNPIGIMRFGFNYGVPLQSVNITEKNRVTQMLNFTNRMRPDAPFAPRSKRKIRASVTQAQIDSVRLGVKNGTLGPAKDFTSGIKRSITRQANRAANTPVVSATARKSIIGSSERAKRRSTSGIKSRIKTFGSRIGKTSNLGNQRKSSRASFMSRRRK